MQPFPNPDSIFRSAIADHIAVVRQLELQRPALEAMARAMTQTLLAGGKILWCGNGGSAADAQHLAAEFVGRFRRERSGLASLALSADTSVLTAIANDYGYSAVFARQVQALGAPGDIVVGISTSGNSANVLAAMEAALSNHLITIGFGGTDGGLMAACTHHLLHVESKDTARIQEVHILAGHMLCDWVELACSDDSLASQLMQESAPVSVPAA